MKVFGMTHKGLVRKANEDRFLVEEFSNGSILAAVADGMGGERGGALAAEMAIESLQGLDPESEKIGRHLRALVRAAHLQISKVAASNPELERMGTTLTAAFLKSGIVTWVHTGDSRAYLSRQGHLIQITEDHSLVGVLLRDDEITEEVAQNHPLRNVLLRCVGCDPLQIDTGSFETSGDDIVLLTTDGLHDFVSNEDIAAVLNSEADIEAVLNRLIRMALEHGGKDNITAAAIFL